MPYKNKEDLAAASRRHYLANRDKVNERTRQNRSKYRQKIRDYIQELKSSTPCADCGTTYPYYVMDFDHQRDKTGNVANFYVYGWGLDRVKEEIAKCEIVCANCHRKRTHRA